MKKLIIKLHNKFKPDDQPGSTFFELKTLNQLKRDYNKSKDDYSKEEVIDIFNALSSNKVPYEISKKDLFNLIDEEVKLRKDELKLKEDLFYINENAEKLLNEGNLYIYVQGFHFIDNKDKLNYFNQIIQGIVKEQNISSELIKAKYIKLNSWTDKVTGYEVTRAGELIVDDKIYKFDNIYTTYARQLD